MKERDAAARPALRARRAGSAKPHLRVDPARAVKKKRGMENESPYRVLYFFAGRSLRGVPYAGPRKRLILFVAGDKALAGKIDLAVGLDVDNADEDLIADGNNILNVFNSGLVEL